VILQTQKQIKKEFTHNAMMFGVVPVYYNKEENIYCVRNGCPRFYSELVIFIVKMYWIPIQIINPKCEPKMWFRLGNKIKK